MRIGMASDDGVHIAAHTGRCKEIVIFEIDGERALRIETRENGHTAHAQEECEEGTDAVSHTQGIQTGSTSFAHHHRSHQDLISAISDCWMLITRDWAGAWSTIWPPTASKPTSAMSGRSRTPP